MRFFKTNRLDWFFYWLQFRWLFTLTLVERCCLLVLSWMLFFSVGQLKKVLKSYIFAIWRFRNDERQLPVLWHQSFLAFAQHYKKEVSTEQRKALMEIIKVSFLLFAVVGTSFLFSLDFWSLWSCLTELCYFRSITITKFLPRFVGNCEALKRIRQKSSCSWKGAPVFGSQKFVVCVCLVLWRSLKKFIGNRKIVWEECIFCTTAAFLTFSTVQKMLVIWEELCFAVCVWLLILHAFG